jgi:hypothetical protein
MWPREVFDSFEHLSSKKALQPHKGLEILDKPGVYVLYRDAIPYYVGQAGKLRYRLFAHANIPNDRYCNFWNFFSVFVVENKHHRDEIEGILIAAMPTANSTKPKLLKQGFPECLKKMLHSVRQGKVKDYLNSR